MYTSIRWGLLASLSLVQALVACAATPEAPPVEREEREPVGQTGAAGVGRLPGAAAFDPGLKRRLAAALEARGPDYVPRTHHLRPDGSPLYSNRLLLESSPYLVQHAHNPVNWYPWGDEAFEAARRLGRPVLLSVGYSTCHWCHVMERESFEDEEIARYLNENYVAIKVDREERPDVDAVYMEAVNALRGRGGWPMTVWLTPDRQPFFGGTYFPARDGDRGARKGFLTFLREIKSQYDSDPDRAAEYGRLLAERVRDRMAVQGGDSLASASVLEAAAAYCRANFDPVHGGRRGRPKFPSSLPLRFLLREARRTGDASLRDIVELTLEKMARGGMYDQVGGGFHRYSTDARWLVPHFEKMLYDNALLAVTYLEGYQATGRKDFADVAREILDYVAREMTSPGGGFYSATDADSPTPSGHEEEGWFFTWTPEEIERAVGKGRARLVAARFGVTDRGNFEGRSILHAAKTVEEVAAEAGLEADEVRRELEKSRELLYAARSKRPEPLRDDKILTSWNGLMISAFAAGGLVLRSDRFVEHAERAAAFVLARLRGEDGRLLRSYKDGRARHAAYLDDYAFLIAALLDLYETTSNVRWLNEAVALQSVLDEHYRDEAGGGYFMTSDEHERLLVREKPARDGAEPSGNSVAAMNLLRLDEFTTDDRYRESADRTLRAFGGRLESHPVALSAMLLAVDYRLDEPKEIVLVAPRSREDAEPFLDVLRTTFVPNRILVVAAQGEDLRRQSERVPLLAGKRPLKGKTTAYVCERGICKLPTTDVGVFSEQISMRRTTSAEER